jgi:hypothetical protein
MDDFTIRPAVDVDLVQILETMQSSRPLPIPQIWLGDNIESDTASSDPSDATVLDEFPCSDDDFDAPEDQIRCVPSLDHDPVETFDLCPAEIPLNIQIMSGILDDQQMLQFNSSEIVSLKSLSPDLLCLLRHFSVGYCRPAAQKSY